GILFILVFIVLIVVVIEFSRGYRSIRDSKSVFPQTSLEFISGPNAYFDDALISGRKLPITKKKVTIGRSRRHVDIYYSVPENQTTSISRIHCTIEYLDNLKCFVITDERSTQGTLVNHRAIQRKQPFVLNDGDIIEIGTVENDTAEATLKFTTK